MTAYSELTQQIGDQWVAAIKRAEEAISSISAQVASAKAKVDLPQLPVPEQMAKFNEQLAGQLPKPSEVVQANFELAQRLMTAQRDLALRLLEAGASAASAAGEPGPAAATDTSTA